MKKADYGIDAPHVIRNLFIFSVIGFITPTLPVISIGQVNISLSGFVFMGVTCFLMGTWMLLYSLYGKMKHRDRMLNLVLWSGNENVLDVGTGRGLMAIGAAKRLTTGKSIGIDIWNKEDLTKNTIENTMNNARLEGVADKVEIIDGNAVKMNFEDNTFDVVVSNLCLHNIYNAPDRKKACDEIGRVLKKGGTAVISDFKHIREYKNNFLQSGLEVKVLSASYFTTFPPLSILFVKKV